MVQTESNTLQRPLSEHERYLCIQYKAELTKLNIKYEYDEKTPREIVGIVDYGEKSFSLKISIENEKVNMAARYTYKVPKKFIAIIAMKICDINFINSKTVNETLTLDRTTGYITVNRVDNYPSNTSIRGIKDTIEKIVNFAKDHFHEIDKIRTGQMSVDEAKTYVEAIMNSEIKRGKESENTEDIGTENETPEMLKEKIMQEIKKVDDMRERLRRSRDTDIMVIPEDPYDDIRFLNSLLEMESFRTSENG